MTVNSYLMELASALVLSPDEKESIETSLSNLRKKIDAHFTDGIDHHFKFGSSTRGTILPRKADPNSDIDYMIVFNTDDKAYEPQTYLNKLKTFIETKYTRSEIFQDHPTIVLELTNIKFELVPAKCNFLTGYQIPARNSDWNKWMHTDPKGFDSILTEANKRSNSEIKRLIRLIKYWNAQKGYPFASFELETQIANNLFISCHTLAAFFYSFWSGFACKFSDAQATRDKVNQMKRKIDEIKRIESLGNSTKAETEIKKILPMP